ncbi:MAG: energy transducer TonB [Sphingomicrobium sp.]
MVTGIEILLLSSVMAVSPTRPLPWFLEEDYPMQAFERKWEGTTIFELTVDPTGRPVGCTVDKSSGYGVLDDRTCMVAMKRARFSPALDSRGAPTYGVYRSRLNWAIDPDMWAQSEVGPDFEVSVNKLPSGASAPVSVKYAVMVDASGAAVDCQAISTGYGDALGPLGCAKLKQDYRRIVALPAGGPVSAVRTAWITFTQ